jgi:uncharacterized protein with HEPN domain
LSKRLTEKYSEISWRNIAGMRDIIAHGYDGIILETMWVSITEDIPVLKDVCERILNDLGSNGL